MDCRTALLTVLDQVDYTNGACRMNEMVGAVLPKEVIALARKAIADEASRPINEEPIYTCLKCGAHHEDGGRGKPPVYCDECGADWK